MPRRTAKRRTKGGKSKVCMTVPEAGAHFYGLKPRASYEAAARGDLPTIKVGKYLKVPIAAMEAKLRVIAERAAERTRASK